MITYVLYGMIAIVALVIAVTVTLITPMMVPVGLFFLTMLGGGR